MTEPRAITEAEYQAWKAELHALRDPLLIFLEKSTVDPLFSKTNLFRGFKNDVREACDNAQARAFCWFDDHRAPEENAETKLRKLREILRPT